MATTSFFRTFKAHCTMTTLIDKYNLSFKMKFIKDFAQRIFKKIWRKLFFSSANSMRVLPTILPILSKKA